MIKRNNPMSHQKKRHLTKRQIDPKFLKPALEKAIQSKKKINLPRNQTPPEERFYDLLKKLVSRKYTLDLKGNSIIIKKDGVIQTVDISHKSNANNQLNAILRESFKKK